MGIRVNRHNIKRYMKMCAGKTRHKYKLSAQYIADQNTKLNHKVYKCPFCDGYHVGTGKTKK